MRLLVFTLLIFTISCNIDNKSNAKSNSNSKSSEKFMVSNDIAYDIFRVSGDYSRLLDQGIVSPVKHLVEVNIGEDVKAKLKNLTYIDWVNLLSNFDSNFGANLILYEFYQKDAEHLSGVSIDEWNKYYKQDDLAYWLELLRGQNLQ